jgi:hypothetical protein
MKEIIGMLAAVLALTVLAVNVLATETATSTASVSVPATCGLSATDISFGSLAPGFTSSDVTSTVSMPTGNYPLIPTIKGADWTPSMAVGQTRWYMTDVTYESMTTLTTSEASIGQSVGFGSPKTVHFKLQIPNGQAAGTGYTQTITFTASC